MLRLLTFGGLAVVPGADGVIPRVGSRRLALLAVVAAAGETGITRDRLVGLFWPEVDEERGRHSLRQALHALKEEAGPILLQTGSALLLDPRHATSDLTEFRAALAAGDRAGAVRLYLGPFLDGFYLTGLDEFERWVDRERERLAGEAATALRVLASEASAAGQHGRAAEWWRRLGLLEPLSGRTAVEHARALAASGDRLQALATLRAHEALVRRELESAPDAEVTSLMAELQRVVPAPPSQAGAGPSVQPLPETVAAHLEAPAKRRRWGRLVAVVSVVAVVLVGTSRWLPGPWADPGRQLGTESPVARRFYEEGLQSFRAARVEIARPLMEAALREDSTFALAAYYLALMGEGDALEARQRALRLAEAAPPRARIQIQADLLHRNHDPAALAAAREWTVRASEEGEAFRVLGSALMMVGDWAGSAAALERALTLFEADGTEPGGCRRCEAFDRLTELYFWWDSLPAVERTARRSLALHPERVAPVRDLAISAARAGDSLRALEYLRRLAAASESAVGEYYALRVLLTLERYDEVEREARRLLASARPSDAALARWMLVIALRNQGRLTEARTLVLTGIADTGQAAAVTADPDYILEAILALEGGDPRRAASLFEINRRLGPARAAGVQARWYAWHSTLTATALALAGDTATVRMLVDTVAYWGERTLYGRDRQAHHFLRGLLLAAGHRDAEAVEEYRLALYSPALGYTRINLELGRALLRLDRPREAVPVLQAALRGEVDASNLYVTRTELHEVLGEAFRRAGELDSTAVHLGAVVRALARADRPVVARRDAAERWLREHDAGTRRALQGRGN